METIIKLIITIESEIKFNIRNTTVINHMIFSGFEKLFYEEDILNEFKEGMKLNKDFNMLTIDLLINNKVERSHRYINNYGELKSSYFINKFDNFQPAEKKEINQKIKDFVKIANEKFILILKNKI